MSDSRWPKEWMDAIPISFDSDKILDALHAVGALKEPPKPRKWFVCEKCGVAYHTSPAGMMVHTCNAEGHDVILVREVLE